LFVCLFVCVHTRGNVRLYPKFCSHGPVKVTLLLCPIRLRLHGPFRCYSYSRKWPSSLFDPPIKLPADGGHSGPQLQSGHSGDALQDSHLTLPRPTGSAYWAHDTLAITVFRSPRGAAKVRLEPSSAHMCSRVLLLTQRIQKLRYIHDTEYNQPVGRICDRDAC
jgi:hypothetical protein